MSETYREGWFDLGDMRRRMNEMGFSETQKAELLSDAQRAYGWMLWAERTRFLVNPAASVLAKFRSRMFAPVSSRDTIGGDVYGTLLAVCESFVANTAHEMSDGDLAAEFDRFERLVGKGERLEDFDRERLFRNAEVIRDRWEQGEKERNDFADAITLSHYLRQVESRKLSASYVRDHVVPRLVKQGQETVACELRKALSREEVAA